MPVTLCNIFNWSHAINEQNLPRRKQMVYNDFRRFVQCPNIYCFNASSHNGDDQSWTGLLK